MPEKLEKIITEIFQNTFDKILTEYNDSSSLENKFSIAEEEISKQINYPFYVFSMQLFQRKKAEMMYLSKSFKEITGLENYHKNGKDIWHYFLNKDSQIKYIKAIKEIKTKPEISFKNLNFTTPTKEEKVLLSATKIIPHKNSKFMLGIIIDISTEPEVKISKPTKEPILSHYFTNISKTLFLKLPISVVITNIIGQIIYVNPFFEKLTGYKRQEVLNKNPRFLKSGKTLKETFVNLWENISHGKSWEGYFINYKKNNEIYYEKAVIFPQIGKSGMIERYIGLKTDITKEVSLKSKILKTNSVFNNIINTSNTGYLVVNANHKIIAFNNYLIELFSISNNDATTKKLHEINFPYEKTITKIVTRALQTGKHQEILHIKEKNRWIELFVEKNTEETVIIISKDITHLKKAEEKLVLRSSQLTDLINIIQVAIFSIDLEGKIKNLNQKASELAGKKKIEPGENLFDYFFTKDGIKDSKMGEILLGNTNELESFFGAEQSEKIKVSVSTTFSKDKANQDIIFCVVNDITKSHKEKELLEYIVAEKTVELQNALSKEKELNILKGDFISKTSHEFRTPLATISIASEFLKKHSDKLTPDKIEQKLSKIMEQTQKMIELLDDFLMIEKFNSNKMIFSPENTNLYNFILTIVNQYKEIYSTFEINLTNNSDRLDVFLDKRLGTSIFQNLIGNAIKYSNNIQIVNINIFRIEDNIIVEISDFGIGIPKEFQKNIFTPFVRAENAAVHEGTGLGLSIVKQSVEGHGGKIEFSSEINQGTTFRVHLPLIK
ncbi:MAG: PAS domain S-box protein [Bacteroidales bacterium]|nr:PAS domain S-box protein [Bacteroidales bacterium]